MPLRFVRYDHKSVIPLVPREPLFFCEATKMQTFLEGLATTRLVTKAEAACVNAAWYDRGRMRPVVPSGRTMPRKRKVPGGLMITSPVLVGRKLSVSDPRYDRRHWYLVVPCGRTVPEKARYGRENAD